MINRSLRVFIGGVYMAIAYGTAQAVNAESINIIFSGTVPHTCTIDSSSQSPASTISANPTDRTNVQVACNEATQVNDEHWAQLSDDQSRNEQSVHAQNRANPEDTSESFADGYRTITPQ